VRAGLCGAISNFATSGRTILERLSALAVRAVVVGWATHANDALMTRDRAMAEAAKALGLDVLKPR
jgi:hypothetical protein